jgi:DNA recombination protein RmuC
MEAFLSVPHHQLLLALGGVALLLVAQWIWLARRTAAQQRMLAPVAERVDRIEAAVREDLAHARREAAENASALRHELLRAMTLLGDRQSKTLEAFQHRLQAYETRVETAQGAQRELLDARLASLRDGFLQTGRELREEMSGALERLGEVQRTSANQSAEAQRERLQAFESRLDRLTGTLGEQLEKLREDNGRRLDEMRRTVDEKLQSTLEKRLGESFSQVSERLEAVHKGLGEMQQLATGVGDLKRVLTNVKTRGTWGEVQLGQLLADLLTPEQYGLNVAVKPHSAERVEFAIRLPGREADDAPVWLPIDAKFPKEDYERLIAASEQGESAAVEEAVRGLEARVVAEARSIADRYLAPPYTTDFAILYLPTEGLYAEITRRPGLTERIQRDHRVVIAGPGTFSALLNSLQMGFRTLAIQRRSSEVWKILGVVKSEFGKFGDTLAKVRKKLREAGNHMDSVERRSRVMQRTLREVEALPAVSAPELLEFDESAVDDDSAADPERSASP